MNTHTNTKVWMNLEQHGEQEDEVGGGRGSVQKLWKLRFKLNSAAVTGGTRQGTYLEYFGKIKIYEQIKKR